MTTTEDRKVPGTLRRITISAKMAKGGKSAELSDKDGLPEPLESGEHNLVTSMLPFGKHAPVLDLDIPHTLVPSSTEGHSHLYLDVPMDWDDYQKLMKVLSEVGIIEDGYYRASVARGFSAARLPWIKKGEEE